MFNFAAAFVTVDSLHIYNMQKYFKISELCRSAAAERLALNNDPPLWAIRNMECLIETILDPLREAYGAPIIVNSGYRSIPVNNAVGGSKTSQHLKGQAADIRGRDRRDTLQIWQVATHSNLPFDQIINEKPDSEGRPLWIHISWSPRPRHEVLTIR